MIKPTLLHACQKFLLCSIVVLISESAFAQKLKLSSAVTAEVHPKYGSIILVCGNVAVDKIGFSCGTTDPAPVRNAKVDAKTSTLRIAEKLYDYKDHEPLVDFVSELKNLDGTNATYRTECTYLDDHNAGAGYHFVFDIPGSPTNSTYEIFHANGKIKTYVASKEEVGIVDGDKVAKKIVVRKGTMWMEIEPGKDCIMQVWDPRGADRELGYISVKVLATKLQGIRKKGDKEVVEAKIKTGLNLPVMKR